MGSEASTADGRPRSSHIGTGHLESAENTRLSDRPPHARGHPLINLDAIQNVNNCITQLTTAVAHMATMLNQVNGVPIPSTMQELGVNIPQPHGRREEPNQSQTLIQDHRSSGTHNRRGSQS